MISSRLVRTIKPFDKLEVPPLNSGGETLESRMSHEARYEEAPARRSGPGFLSAFIGKTILLALTIVIVWLLYGYLFAFQLDFLGWAYTKLQPLTLQLYALVDTYFPDSVRYKFRAAITDDLGQRALFLLLLTATVELTLYTFYRFVKSLFGRN